MKAIQKKIEKIIQNLFYQVIRKTFAEVSEKLSKIQMPIKIIILTQMSWKLVCRSLSWWWIEMHKQKLKINFYMVSGGIDSPFLKFTSFEDYIFKNWAILIIFVLIVCKFSEPFSLFNLAIFNFEVFLTDKKLIFDITQL